MHNGSEGMGSGADVTGFPQFHSVPVAGLLSPSVVIGMVMRASALREHSWGTLLLNMRILRHRERSSLPKVSEQGTLLQPRPHSPYPLLLPLCCQQGYKSGMDFESSLIL